MNDQLKFLIIFEQINHTVEVDLAALRGILNVERVITRYISSRDVSAQDLNWCDACYAIRPSSIYSLTVAKSLKSSGRLFISFFDDDLLSVSKSSSLYWRIKYIKTCMLMSDLVVACNSQLIESYREKVSPNLKFVMTEAFVLESDIQPIMEAGEKIRIVYVAGRDHTRLFENYICPIIDEVLAMCPGRIEFHLMGVEPDLSKIFHRNQVISHETRSYEKYKEFMRLNNFDIGLAPLDDDSFSNKKYFRKFIDYAEFGIAGIYSNCAPYTFVVKDGYNGVLVNNSTKDWCLALKKAIDNISEMKEMAKMSQQKLRESFSLSSARSHFWEQLNPVIDSLSDKSEVKIIHHRVSEYFYVIMADYHRVKSHLMTDGIARTCLEIIKKMFIFFKVRLKFIKFVI